MLALGVWTLWLRWRDRLYETPLAHRAAILMGPSGFIAVSSRGESPPKWGGSPTPSMAC